jgi:hypothetical protein
VADHQPQFLDIVINTVGAIFTLMFGWLLKHTRWQGKRITTLEANSVPREEYNETIESLRRDIKENNEKTINRVEITARDTHKRLDDLLMHLDRRRD